MIQKNAVLITVLFAFAVTMVSISSVFWEFFKSNKQHHIEQIFTKHTTIIQIFRQHQQGFASFVMLEANLAVYNFIIEKDDRVDHIVKTSRVLKSKNIKNIDTSIRFANGDLYSQNTVANLEIKMLQHNKNIYFLVASPFSSVLILDTELKPYTYWPLAYVYLTVVSVIFLSFVLILQRLRPLIRLRKKIALYGSGNMNISFKTSGYDEIALISNELEATKENINKILESRTLFLRNIMHELKTPIAKGTIATQMLDSKKQIDRFSSIFGRLESLVN